MGCSCSAANRTNQMRWKEENLVIKTLRVHTRSEGFSVCLCSAKTRWCSRNGEIILILIEKLQNLWNRWFHFVVESSQEHQKLLNWSFVVFSLEHEDQADVILHWRMGRRQATERNETKIYYFNHKWLWYIAPETGFSLGWGDLWLNVNDIWEEVAKMF